MSDTPMEPSGDRLGFLLAAAAWQDSLLQAYRTLLMASQAPLLALDTALFAANFAFDSVVNVYLVSGLILIIAIGGACANWRLQGVVKSRSADVDFWHKELLQCETSLLPAERLFTRFKIHQHAKEQGWRADDPRRDALLESASTPALTDAGLGDTRKVIDRQFAGTLLGGWAVLAASTVVYAAIAATIGVP